MTGQAFMFYVRYRTDKKYFAELLFLTVSVFKDKCLFKDKWGLKISVFLENKYLVKNLVKAKDKCLLLCRNHAYYRLVMIID